MRFMAYQELDTKRVPLLHPTSQLLFKTLLPCSIMFQNVPCEYFCSTNPPVCKWQKIAKPTMDSFVEQARSSFRLPNKCLIRSQGCTCSCPFITNTTWKLRPVTKSSHAISEICSSVHKQNSFM